MDKANAFLTTLVTALTLVLGVSPNFAQNTQTLKYDTNYFPRDWKWTEEELVGSDAPYVKIRATVDNAIANKQNLDVLTRRYAKIAADNLNDPQAQFAWGYAAVLSRKPGTNVGRQVPNAISKALATAHSPRTYQYTRMRYLMLLTWGTWIQLKDLGKSLLIRNPDDWRVKRHLIRLLASGTQNERQQALIYANQVVIKYPKLSFSHGNLGDVYREIFYRENKVTAGQKAITAYQKALALNPNPTAKDDMIYLTNVIRKRISRLQKEQKGL